MTVQPWEPVSVQSNKHPYVTTTGTREHVDYQIRFMCHFEGGATVWLANGQKIIVRAKR